MKDPAPSTMFSSRFQFFTPSAKLVKRRINPKVEDVMYNYTNVTSMTKSQTGWAFKAAKEFHVITLQAFINVCSPPNCMVVDLKCKMAICFHLCLIFLDSKLFMQPFVSSTFAFDCS